MITGTLHIKLLSDWHIGSGTGRPGSIDRLVQRDQDNLPYIPAKSLTGIWRDGCELVAQGLDADCSDPLWQRWVNWLFGDQQPEENQNRVVETAPLTAKLSVRSAHFPEDLRQAFQGNVMLQNMTTFVKPGVKIDPRTGSALADHLRFEEMARASAVLESEYCLHLEELPEEYRSLAQAILVTGALMVERLGAKRRRGAGRCELKVTEMMTIEAAITAIEKTNGQPPILPLLTQSNAEKTLALDPKEGKPDAGWWRIVLNVTTQTPVIVHQRTVGNHQETHDCIPGTHFVPTILKQLGTYLNTSLGNALMHGDVVITNANPVINQSRTEAVPYALFEPKAKTESAAIHQRIGEIISSEISNGQQLKGIRRGYVTLEQDTLHQINVNPEIAAHNTIVDAKQRPDAEVGGIYTYAAIPANLSFQLEVRIRDYLVPKNAVNPLKNFLTEKITVQIGRTKKDDYGKVALQQSKSEKIQPGTKKESASKESVQNRTEILTVWLLSDLLLRDERLRPTLDPTVLGQQLGTALGVELTLVDASQAEPATQLPEINRLVAFARSSRIESWQTKWGLPRPTLVGLRAGTVLQFTVKGIIDPQKLRALEISGLGERTAEGYGQLQFNPALLLQTNLKLAKSKEPPDPSTAEPPTLIQSGAPGYKYAELIERETWRELMRRTAAAIAADSQTIPLDLNRSKLSLSKLGTLRTLIDSLRDIQDATRIVNVINRMESKERWKDSTLTQVKQLIANPTDGVVWECYQSAGCNFSAYRLTTRDEQDLKRELWVEALRTLVDACVRAHKRASEQPTLQEQTNG